MNKILEAVEIQSLNLRNAIIQNKTVELQILTREKEIYQKELLEKYGLDPSKKYSIDERGVIAEVENADDKRPDNV